MSGTASGTIILHVAPEAAIGGPLALVQNGDRICLDAAARRLELLVSDDELARRRAALQLPVTASNRGYGKLFHDHVVQAPGGVDFDFLQGVDTADADAGV
jgi:dihydroxy-acid dehydratase